MDVDTGGGSGFMDMSWGREVTHGRPAWVLGQTLAVVACIFTYFGVRGVTEGSHAVAVENAQEIVALERRLGIHVEAQLQEPFTTWHQLETLANWVYIWGHWPVIVATMVWLVWHHRPVFERLRDAMLISGLVGMVIFALYPVAPPRLAGLGMVDTITSSSQSYRVLQPPAFVNQYAAMPSLHTGWDLLVGMAIVSAATTTVLKVVGWLMPIMMAIAVVVTGNHYLLDAVAGIALVLLAHGAALALERRRQQGGTAVGATTGGGTR
ncbi:phosphatase PAP2 family protein [Nocardioides pacificus]